MRLVLKSLEITLFCMQNETNQGNRIRIGWQNEVTTFCLALKTGSGCEGVGGTPLL